MSRCIYGLLILIAVMPIPSEASGMGPQDAVQTKSGDGKPETPKRIITRANQLFDQKRWNDARERYDQAQASTIEDKQIVARQTVRCATALADWDDAIQRAVKYRKSEALQAKALRYWPSDEPELARLTRDIQEIDFARELFLSIWLAAKNNGVQVVQNRAAMELIATDFALLKILDPDSVVQTEKWGWESGYPNTDWWWRDVPTEPDLFDAEERPQVSYRRHGLPADRDGKPLHLRAPTEYPTKLNRAERILYLLDEIERIDSSEAKSQIALARLHRADLMRRVYGPHADPAWSNGLFYYQFAQRPTFERQAETEGVKQFWELADDEARVQLNNKLMVITLPAEISPMAIWQRIAKDHAGSEPAAEAIYQRALYYQNRRQFSKAIAEYERLVKQFPNHARAAVAKTQISSIRHADVLLGSTGVYTVGKSPKLWFGSRNTTKVEFTARSIDLVGFLANRTRAGQWWELANFGDFMGHSGTQEELQKFIGAEASQWSEPASPPPESQPASTFDQVTTHWTLMPLAKPGAYLVEARAAGSEESSSALVIVTGVVIIQKRLPDKVLLWAVDARNGRPLPNQEIKLLRENNRNRQSSTAKTDQDGVLVLRPEEREYIVAFLATQQGDLAWAEVERIGGLDENENKTVSFAVTDRPLYRPGSEVNFRCWVRSIKDRTYERSKAGTQVQVNVSGPQHGNIIRTFDLVTDETGSVNSSLQLSSETPLGRYSISISDPSEHFSPAACHFSVEEYKKPEFAVTVSASKGIARLGEPIKARIQADYYTGQPVVGAHVRYRIYRRRHLTVHHAPTPWDWLYGSGFGNMTYQYPWLGDSIMTVASDPWSRRYGYYDPADALAHELLEEGIERLNEKGGVEISFETAKLAKESDQEFTISAEVRDESRRTIKASGKVLATRQQFFAFTQLDRGWYLPGDDATVDIHTCSANNIAVATSGTASLFRVTIVNGSNDPKEFQKEIIATWPVKTDASGSAKLSFKVPNEGQYRFEFQSSDATEQPVTSASTFWGYGPNFKTAQHKFAGLEIIPDKRFYQVGDTARLLIHTAQINARLFVVDSLHNYRFIDIPLHSQVVEIPIAPKHIPSFFFEATLVVDGQVVNDSCELFVPPVDDLLKIQLKSDRQTYKPGEKEAVQIQVTDARGKAVSGSIALRAFDKSLSYIEPDVGFEPRTLLQARYVDDWYGGVEHTLVARKFEVSGVFTCPEYHMEDGSRPLAGGMGGSPPNGGDPADSASLASNHAVRMTSARIDHLTEEELIDPTVRIDFSDTAAWLPKLQLDEAGKATAEITFPESLTNWQIQGCLVTPDTKVGLATYEVKTNKDLLVRLQTPRFAIERDEVVLSANVHNYLADAKEVSAELILPAALFQSLSSQTDASMRKDEQGNLHLVQRAMVAPGKVQRLDWPMKMLASGLANITVKARTDVESDAMQLAFPVHAHGIVESQSQSGYFQAKQTGNQDIDFELPAAIAPGSVNVELTVLPSPAGAAFEALPFLAGYPYGCVEQTMSRFYPTVLATATLKKLDTDVEAIAGKLSKRTSADDKRAAGQFSRSAIVDSAELSRMTEAGLQRLYKFQHGDGGWGWWEHDASSPYMTAYVLLGLNTAADAGLVIEESTFQNGMRYLLDGLDKPLVDEWTADSQSSTRAGVERSLLAYVLSLLRLQENGEHQLKIRKLVQSVYNERAELNPYGRALLALALYRENMRDKSKEVLQSLTRDIETDAKLNESWIATEQDDWWLWHNSDIETNAWVLRAILAIDPEPELASRIANWLASQRQHARYWRSTRDSALAVHALADYMLAMKQDSNGCQVSVLVDGKPFRNMEVNWQNMLEMETRLSLTGESLQPGKHRITLIKKDQGPLHFSLNSEYFVKYDRLQAKTHSGLRIERSYYRSQGAKPSGQTKSPLKFGDTIAVGETIEVELAIKAEKNFEFLAFEDFKPAGCEPFQLRSGYGSSDGLYCNMELRDAKVVFFVTRLTPGEHQLRYRLRAEQTGKFAAMPAEGFAMYAPEIRANSDEMQLIISD